MVEKLDALDLRILGELQKDARTSVTTLSDAVYSSRPTVTIRLKRLLEEERAIIRGGLNLRKLGFKMALVGLEVKGDDVRRDTEQYLKGCPRVLNIFRTPEKANIQLSVWGEDEQTINSTIESFRDLLNVEVVYTHYLGTPIHGDVVLKLESSVSDKTPCGKICSDCHRFKNTRCPGCPLSSDYENPLLK